MNLLIALALSITPVQSTKISDQQMLEMGHDRWIAHVQSFSDGASKLTDAEKRFATALGVQNQRQIAFSSEQKYLDELVMYLSNITKGSDRIADYRLEGTENASLYNAKSWSVTNIAIHKIASRAPADSNLSQAKVWSAFKAARDDHNASFERIEAFRQRSGGYTAELLGHEVNSIRILSTKTMQLISDRPDREKQHVFAVLIKMINLTTGADPLPYS